MIERCSSSVRIHVPDFSGERRDPRFVTAADAISAGVIGSVSAGIIILPGCHSSGMMRIPLVKCLYVSLEK